MYPFITDCCIDCGRKLVEWEQILYVHTCTECCKAHKKTGNYRREEFVYSKNKSMKI